MKIKNYFVLMLFFLFNFFGNAQESGDNYQYCKEMILANKDYSVRTKFYIYQPLTENEMNLVKSLLFEKSSIYNVDFNSKGTELYVSHLSQVHFEDIKVLLQDTGIEFNYISTNEVSFGKNIKH